MRWLDRVLRDMRIAQALPFIRNGDRLLDIGCFDETLLRLVAPKIQSGVGVDGLAKPSEHGNIRILRGMIPGDVKLPDGSFDCITMLAVLEHIPDTSAIAKECERLLAPGGRVVITVPKPRVDWILNVLSNLRLIDGLSLEEHHGYDPARTGPVFESAGLVLVKQKSFECGLNCLFVFEKPTIVRERESSPTGSAIHSGLINAATEGAA